MQRIRRAFLALRENREKGVSLIVALCAVAVLLGLSLSLVYSASLPMARANRKIDRERCYQLAQSFANVLDGELRAYTTENSSLFHESGYCGDSGTFYHYANNVLENTAYAEFDQDDPLHTTFYLTTKQDTDGYGHEVISLRKEVEKERPTGGEFPYEQSATRTTEVEHATFLQYHLTVLVQASLHNDSYTYSTEYDRKDSFAPEYTWNGEGDDKNIQVFWDGHHWYTDASHTVQKEPKIIDDGDDRSHVEAVNISYTYDTSNITYKIYQPTDQNNNSGGGTNGQASGTAEESAG